MKKNEKGSITLMVIVLMLFFLIMTISAYISSNNKKINQEQEIGRIQETYKSDIEKIDHIYNKIKKSNEVEITIPIPDGFVISQIPDEQNVDEGLVIYEIPEVERESVDWKTQDKNGVYTVQTLYNQYVWIPVELEEGEKVEEKYPRKTFNNDETVLDEIYMEPYKNGYSEEESDYQTMLDSINKYHGFYIGRYEAGCKNKIDSASDNTQIQEIIIRQGAYVYNYIPWGLSMNDISDVNGIAGAVKLSKSLTKENYITNLIYGIQWDMIVRFLSDRYNINDSSTWGNYDSDEIYTTGYNENWQAKNI